MDLLLLQHIWYGFFILSMFAYAALDGFDIGVGCLHLFSSTDRERRLFINSIGPIWDSNSLWIIISSGSLFAGFPKAFATLLSSFYLAIVALVFGYILRAAAVEFRSKKESQLWRNLWDRVFCFSSYTLGFGFGFILANLIQGIPLGEDELYQGTFFDLISPYSVGLGIFTTLMFMLHGGLFLNIKLTGELQGKVRTWLNTIYSLFLAAWICITMSTLVFEPSVAQHIRQIPWLFFVELTGIIGLVLIPRYLARNKEGLAFISSIFVIASMVINYAVGTFPAIVRSSLHPYSHSITIFNSSGTSLTMHILLGIATAGIPFFLMYCGYAFRVFQGKVEIDTMSY